MGGVNFGFSAEVVLPGHIESPCRQLDFNPARLSVRPMKVYIFKNLFCVHHVLLCSPSSVQLNVELKSKYPSGSAWEMSVLARETLFRVQKYIVECVAHSGFPVEDQDVLGPSRLSLRGGKDLCYCLSLLSPFLPLLQALL